MELIEEENPDLVGVLPRDYARIDNRVLAELLRLIGTIPDDIEGDAIGKIYEYFLGNFAMTEGQRGGEFFTPTSIVKLIVDIIEPFEGRILDPACGSGGMFVQSARFVEQHQGNTNEISIFGQERVEATIRLAKMNLAVHGLGGSIVPSNTYYEDPHNSLGRFDFVIANPPFNVNAIDKDRIKDDKRRPKAFAAGEGGPRCGTHGAGPGISDVSGCHHCEKIESPVLGVPIKHRRRNRTSASCFGSSRSTTELYGRTSYLMYLPALDLCRHVRQPPCHRCQQSTM